MSNIIEYSFSGVASVSCEKCSNCVEIKFSGMDIDVEEAIEEALNDKGWDSGVCPDCQEEYDENDN